MTDRTETGERSGLILEPLVLLFLLAGLLAAQQASSAHELGLRDRISLGVALGLLYGGVGALVVAGIRRFARRGSGTSAASPGVVFTASMLLVPVALYGLSTWLDLTRLARDARATPPPLAAVTLDPRPLLLVGFSGLSYDGLDSLRARNAVPLLDSLAAAGAIGKLPEVRTSPAAAWTTVTSGVPVERHGVRAPLHLRVPGLARSLSREARQAFGLDALLDLALRLGAVRRVPVSATVCRVPRLWDLAAAAEGRGVYVVGWPATSGATLPRGAIASDVALVAAEPDTSPDIRALAAADRALAGEPAPSLLALCLAGAEVPSGTPRDGVARVAALDGRLRSLLQRMPSDTRVVVVGLDPARSRDGVLLIAGDGIASQRVRELTLLDVFPSCLALLGLPRAEDLVGRARVGDTDGDGSVPTYGRYRPDRAEPPVDARVARAFVDEWGGHQR